MNRRLICSVLYLATLALSAACTRSEQSTDGTTSWLACEDDSDCASLGDEAFCGDEGRCVEPSGVLPPASQDAGDGTTQDAAVGPASERQMPPPTAAPDAASEPQMAPPDAAPAAPAPPDARVDGGDPRKLSNVPASGTPATTLHLYVSNQSFDRPLVGIDVYLDDTQVVTGAFDVAGQHNWILFDIEAPEGTLVLRAESPDDDTTLEQEVELPAERWGVLEYWFYPDQDAAPYFSFRLSDMPVLFD